MKLFIPSILSIISTLNPKALNSLILYFCIGLGSLPGALSSTKTILPCGNKIILSGTPDTPGLTNFKALPPNFSISFLSLFSILDSSI